MNPPPRNHILELLRLGLPVLLATGLPCPAAEMSFDFAAARLGEPPPDFRSTVSGEGPPGDWRIVDDNLSRDPTLPRSSVTVQNAVLAQLSRFTTDERFPLLIYQPQIFGDFTLTTRFKTVSGAVEQMAGLAFRIQDEKNYYVVRASSLGNSFVFYKFVDGIRTTPIGVQTTIPTNTWHDLTIECLGNQIHCRLNGRELFPPLTDSSFADGRIGFWTKSDSVSYFRDAQITYTPKEIHAKALVREVMEKFPRLVGVIVCASPKPGAPAEIIAGSNPENIGQPGTDVDKDVLAHGHIFYGKDKEISEVAMPLRDRNGEPIASVRVLLKRFPGQTRANAMARARPIVDYLQSRILSARDLTR